MSSALVLGAGMVGAVMAADLATDGDMAVTIADRSPEALDSARRRCAGRPIKAVQIDLADAASVRRLALQHDVVLGALASRLGFATLRAVIEARRNYCDISFMPEDAWTLNDVAKRAGVTAVVDCGVAPGMSNMLAGWAAASMDDCRRIDIMVGGLPRERRWPFQYKAAFSPHDVIEEYVRPARIVEHGQIVVREALSEPELIDFGSVGTLEAFNTDGLRSLAHFLKAPFMRERTLRYPGHIEIMRIFRETGLFSVEPITVGGATVRPRDMLAALMFPKWTYGQGEEDLTVMRVVVEGTRDGRAVRHQWDLFDVYDRATSATSMSRTTAFPCTIVARMLARGQITSKGVVPPELLGAQHGVLDHVRDELAKRGVKFAHEQT